MFKLTRTSLLWPVCSLLLFGCGPSGDSSPTVQPSIEAYNSSGVEDFEHLDSPLAEQGGPEFVAFCKEAGHCDIRGDVEKKLEEIMRKYLTENEEEFYYFAAVVVDGLTEAKLIPEGDPENYRYHITTCTHYASSKAMRESRQQSEPSEEEKTDENAAETEEPSDP